jgi:hypothetical protein
MTDEVRRADVRHTRRLSLIALSMVLPAVLLTGGCSMFGKLIPGFSPAPQTPVATGAWQVPPNDSKASASGTIRVGADRSVSGVIGLRGIEATGVRIHTGVAGVKGAPIVTLARTAASTYAVPAGVYLSQAQYVAWQAGNLYIDVQSAGYPEGELRGQLKP